MRGGRVSSLLFQQRLGWLVPCDTRPVSSTIITHHCSYVWALINGLCSTYLLLIYASFRRSAFSERYCAVLLLNRYAVIQLYVVSQLVLIQISVFLSDHSATIFVHIRWHSYQRLQLSHFTNLVPFLALTSNLWGSTTLPTIVLWLYFIKCLSRMQNNFQTLWISAVPRHKHSNIITSLDHILSDKLCISVRLEYSISIVHFRKSHCDFPFRFLS